MTLRRGQRHNIVLEKREKPAARTYFVTRLFRILFCAALLVEAAFSASRLVDAENRAFELRPAAVLISAGYKIDVEFFNGHRSAVKADEPLALQLMCASEKCAADEDVVVPATENSDVLVYSGIGAIVMGLALVMVLRKRGPQPGGAPAISERTYGSVQVTAGALSGKKFKVPKAGLLVGTDPSKCQIVVSEDTISHEHAWIVPVENSVVVIDHGSTNGTYVNSVESPRVSKVSLQNGDRVYLGKKGSVVLTYFSS